MNTDKEAKIQQSFETKFQFADEVSNETYLGLTDTDFKNNILLNSDEEDEVRFITYDKFIKKYVEENNNNIFV